jgi:large subunit ribosomal protein L21
MFAVIKTGGKQYRVTANDIIAVEYLAGNDGDSVVFNEVLMTGKGDDIQTGKPTLKKVVQGTIVSQSKGPKLYIQKFRRRKNSKTRTGHRQLVTQVRITAIKDA